LRFVFLTNQASYHQMDFARAMVAELGEAAFRIVFQKPTSEARAEMGWRDDYVEPYILRYWQEQNEVEQWIADAEVVIQGRFPISKLRDRIKSGKLTFACQERLWKKPPSPLRKLSRFGHLYKNYWSVNKPNYHFLAIGQFAAQDLNDLGFFKGRSWRFGYFTDVPNLQVKPQTNEIKLFWCARMSEVKQPWRAIEILQGLHKQGVAAKLTMIGDGELRVSIEQLIQVENLQEHVDLLGWQSQQQVFERMQDSHLFLMTSHHGEGWGLVVNEALSRGCPVVANHLLGSAAWLVDHGQTGFLYQDSGLANLIDQLAGYDIAQFQEMGQRAQQAMQQLWSASVAAQRIIHLSKILLTGEVAKAKALYQIGPCALIG